MTDLFEEDFDDVMPLCSNCKYDSFSWECLCKQREIDITNGCEKEKINGFCGYFEEQDWIKKAREKS